MDYPPDRFALACRLPFDLILFCIWLIRSSLAFEQDWLYFYYIKAAAVFGYFASAKTTSSDEWANAMP